MSITAIPVLGLVVYLALVFFVVRAPLRRIVADRLARHGSMQLTFAPNIVILLFVSAAITSNLGVFAIIGGFVIGVALHDDRQFVEEWKHRVSPIVWVFFLPIFFAYTGLRTDIAAIQGWPGLVTLLAVLAVAFAGKLGSAYAMARLVGEGQQSALTIGVCMNTRGMMELIVLNIGKDLGLLPTDVFSMLVIMAPRGEPAAARG